MWRLGSLRIGNRDVDVRLGPRLPSVQATRRKAGRGQLCFMAVGSDLCSQVHALRERIADERQKGMQTDWLLISEAAGRKADAVDEAVARDNVTSVLARNDLIIVVCDSRRMRRSEMLDIDRFRIGLPRTRWLLFDVGCEGMARGLTGDRNRDTTSFAVGGAPQDLRIRDAVDTFMVAMQTGITKQSSLVDYVSCVGSRAVVVAELYGIGVGVGRATVAVDAAVSDVSSSGQTLNGGHGAVVAIAVPAGGTLGEYCTALDRIRERLPETRIVADFVGKDARDGFEVAIILTRPIH